jgi:hypothetical protein
VVATITEDLLTARSITPRELVGRLQIAHEARQDVVSPAGKLRMDDGHLIADFPASDPIVSETGVAASMVLRPTDLGLGDIAEKLGIPTAYLRRMRTEGATSLLDHNVNEWLGRQGDRRYLVRGLVDGSGTGLLRSLLSGNYEIADNYEVLLAMLDGLKAAGVTAVPTTCDLSPRRMYVTIHAPEIAAMAPGLMRNYVSPFSGNRGMDNPLVFAGLALSNSETGDGAWTISPRLEFEVCANGLVLDKLAVRKRHIGERLPEGAVQWSDDTRQTNHRLIAMKTRDAVRSFLNEEWLTARIGELEREAGVRVSNPTEVIERVSKELRFSEVEQQTILDHFLLGADPTSGGVMQAVTSAAQTVKDPDTARGMESAGVKAMRLAAQFARN